MSLLLQIFVVPTQLLRRSRALASMLPALLQSAALTLLLSAALRVMWLDSGHDFFGAWMETWLTTWPIAFPLIYLLAPLLRRLARRQPARAALAAGLPVARRLKPDTTAA